MDRVIVTISPSTTGQELSLLCTSEFTRIGRYWVWIENSDDNTIHISDSIDGTVGLHRIGSMDDRLSDFRPANGRVTGRAALLRAGYRVSIEDDVLYVRLGDSTIVRRELDGDYRHYQWYRIRGWRAVKLHSEGKGLEGEDYWWEKVEKIEVKEEKNILDMTMKEIVSLI